MFLEPSRGPLQIATMISEGCFQKFFDRKSEPWKKGVFVIFLQFIHIKGIFRNYVTV
jgi:hypothetical protein